MATLSSGDLEVEMEDSVLRFMVKEGKRIDLSDLLPAFAIAVSLEGGSSLIYVPAIPVEALGQEVFVSEREREAFE